MRHHLKSARVEKGFTQLQVAKAVGISLKSYQRIESGTHDTTTTVAIAIARLLSSSVEDLFDNSE